MLENITSNNLNYHGQLSDAGKCGSERHTKHTQKCRHAGTMIVETGVGDDDDNARGALGMEAKSEGGNLRMCVAC